MRRRKIAVLVVVILTLARSISSPLTASRATLPLPDLTPTAFSYLPYVASPRSLCPGTSTNEYQSGVATQYDTDDPVRPAHNHADKNIELRGYAPTDPQVRDLVDYGSDDPVQPPQLATMFEPARVPTLASFYQVHHWNWSASPNPGQRGNPITDPPVTALGLRTTPGESLHVPTSGYDIGGGMEVLVLFADEDTVALRYTREDSSGSPGYTVHVDGICTDPNLLALYQTLDDPDGPRYEYPNPSYELPNLPAGQPVGVARGGDVVVAIADSGAFQDPRSLNEWWQVRPGYPGDVVYPTDDDYAKQWPLDTVGAPQAWPISTGQNTVIAVLDTGVDLDHPDLEGKILSDQDQDFVNDDLEADDDHGHGTHVAGIAAAATNNGIGIAGLGWDAEILPLKVLGADEVGSLADIEAAITYATDSGAHVINLSLGSSQALPCPSTLQTSIDYAHENGVVVVAAAGNQPSTPAPEVFPGNCDHVLAIGATAPDDALAETYSNCGHHVSGAAPGGTYDCPTCSVYSTFAGGGYGRLSGTSMAAPHVAGLAALLLARYPDYTPDQVASAILDNAVDLGTPGWDECFGCGRIDAFAALSIGARGPEPLCLQPPSRSGRQQRNALSEPEAPFAPGELIVELRPGVVAASLLDRRAAPATRLSERGLWRIHVPVGQEHAMLARLRDDEAVLHADLNYLVVAQ